MTVYEYELTWYSNNTGVSGDELFDLATKSIDELFHEIEIRWKRINTEGYITSSLTTTTMKDYLSEV